MYNPFDDKRGEIITGVEQGTEEWLALRCGCITSSCVRFMMAKGSDKLSYKDYVLHLMVERITGKPLSGGFKSKAMKKGNNDEPLAREEYWFNCDEEIETVSFIKHPFLPNCGASPDALVGDDGGLEIKCPDSKTHLKYLIDPKVPTIYFWQIHWLIACSGRDWWDFMSFDKSMPNDLRRLIIRVERDEKKIKQLEDEAVKLNDEVEQSIKKLRSGK